MKSSIAIITICDNINYGNRLQNYAMVYKLKKMGIESETIWPKLSFARAIMKRIKKKRKLDELEIARFNNFKKFSDSYTNVVYKRYNKRLQNDYYKILVGSDQIWNFDWQLWLNKFTAYISKEKMIAYAPSFGIFNINEKYKRWYKKVIDNFGYLSVREDRGKEIIFDLTGRKDVEVLIDPTLLLSKEEWDKLAIMPQNMEQKKYILSYFLGEQSDETKRAIEKVAKENNCTIINLLDKNDSYYTCGPEEFLYLEKNAFLICTDSFHSCVFAFIFDRPFVVFERKGSSANMSSRIDTLIKKFDLKNRRYNESNITKENIEHDYSEAYRILEKERIKSKEFLEKALDIK